MMMMMMMIFAKAHCPRQRNTNQTTKKQTDRQAAEKPGFFFVFFKGKVNPGIITLTVEAPQQWDHHCGTPQSCIPSFPSTAWRKKKFPFLEENDILQQQTQWYLWGLGFRVCSVKLNLNFVLSYIQPRKEIVDWPDRGYRWSYHSCQWQSQISRLFSHASSSPILLPPPQQQQQLPLWRQVPVSPLMTLMWMQTFAAAKTQLPIYSSTNEHSRWSPKFNDNPLGQWAMIWSSLHPPWSGFGFSAEFPKKTHLVQKCERFLKTGDQQTITIHRSPLSCFPSVLQALTKHAHFARGFLHTHYTHDCPGHPCKHFKNLSAPLPVAPPPTFFLSLFCSRSLRPAANTQPSCCSAILLLLSLFFLLLWIATSLRDWFLERFWRRDSAGVRRPRGVKERRFFKRDIPIPTKAWPLVKALFIRAMAQRPNPR